MSENNIYLKRPWLNCYPEGMDVDVYVPDISIPQAFDEAAEAYAEQTAVVFYGKEIKFRELKEMADRLAHAVADLGVRKGDRVVLYLLNSPQLLIAFFGALKAGASVTVVNPTYTAEELKFLMKDSEAEFIVCQDILYPTLKKSGSNPQNIIVSDTGDFVEPSETMLGAELLKAYGAVKGSAQQLSESSGVYSFMGILESYSPVAPDVSLEPQEDAAAVPYTGGTTAMPKGAVLTHYNLMAEHRQFKAVWPMLNPGEEVFPAFLPFSHIFGQALCLLHGIVMGATLLVFSTPNMQEILKACEYYKATIFTGVPTLYEMLKEYDVIKQINWKRFKILMAAGDALRESTANEWKEKTGSQLFEGFGLTETSGAVFANPFHRPKIGSMGCPMPGVRAAVINNESGEFAPVGEIGELLISGPSVMKGYWKREEDNQKVFEEFDDRKWFRTGDMVRMDEEGYFHYYSRSKDLIKYKGHSVFAREVEEVISNYPRVSEVAVIGVPDVKVGEFVKAFVVPLPGEETKIEQDEVLDHCKERLAGYKVPRMVEFRSELPKTNVGKLLRRALKEEALES